MAECKYQTKTIINILDNQLSTSKCGIVEITDTLTKEIIERLNEQDKALEKACKELFYARVFDGMTPANIKEYLLNESESKNGKQ